MWPVIDGDCWPASIMSYGGRSGGSASTAVRGCAGKAGRAASASKATVGAALDLSLQPSDQNRTGRSGRAALSCTRRLGRRSPGIAGRHRTEELLLDGAADAGSTAEPLLHGF
jgi:hypothetical protein